PRTQPRRILWPGCFLRVRQSELSDHSFSDVVRGWVHLHGTDVHPPRHTSPMVTRVVSRRAQRYSAILCLCVSVAAGLAFAVEKEPLQEYRSRRERLAQRIKGN